MTLAKDYLSVVCQHFQRTFPLKLLVQFHFNFIPAFRQGGGEVYIFSAVHIAKMAATPIYGKSFKTFLLQNHWADCHGSWYLASWDLVL